MTPLLFLFSTIKILLCEPFLSTRPHALLLPSFLPPLLSPSLFSIPPFLLPFLPSIMLVPAAWLLERRKEGFGDHKVIIQVSEELSTLVFVDFVDKVNR